MIPRHLQITFGLLLAGIFVLGLTMLQLKNRAQDTAQRASDAGLLAPPVSAPEERLTLYVAYDDEGVLLKRTVKTAVPSETTARAKQVLRTLFGQYLDKPSPHPLGPGSDVNEVFVVNQSLAIIDLNSAFAEGHRSGVWEETLTVDSIVATLGANMPGITQVKILVDGQERETLAGHADLMSIYQVAEINQLVQDLR